MMPWLNVLDDPFPTPPFLLCEPPHTPRFEESWLLIFARAGGVISCVFCCLVSLFGGATAVLLQAKASANF